MTVAASASSDRDKLRQAKALLSDSARLLKRARSLGEAPRGQIVQARAELGAALQNKDVAAVERTARALDELSVKHLSKYKKSGFREYFDSIFWAVLVALTLRAFVFEAFKIPSGSMIPTLEINDQIFVNKYIYGLRVPFTFLKFFEWNEPKRGEVIVFIYPEDHSKDYIKRVVGLPGDTIEMRAGQLYINEQPVPREPGPVPCEYWDKADGVDWSRHRCTGYAETLGEITHPVLMTPDYSRVRDYGPMKVSPRHLFVMGDNRDNSLDSRTWGLVPYENIKGRAMFIWWAWNRDGLNPSRMFSWIQ